MNKNLYNEDYIKGIKFLLEKSREQGINIRKIQWVPNVCKMLSESNLCYKFWHNVWQQNRLNKVHLCNNWYDVMYVPDRWLILWSITKEGSTFWRNHLWKMLGLGLDDANFFNYPRILQDMKLE